ncbi:cell wall hydrolase [Paracoccus contaminans]|uniref:Cell wall hydrolase n=1 Tax=Paracoccus contaminans TaxID=1945662 RepID=A0A1W6CWF1_9RHOB|nr:cell wall hydrolase [Paracoccus contaminans]ARJ69184.1 cell wall hydrolase [Paracoccus contaminans]
MLPSRPPIRPALWLMLGLALSGCGLARRQSEQDCMMRAMYFESNRSSREGMIAVGSVVMNRLQSGKYPRSVCGVVGQPRQFAPGVLTRPMKARDMRLAQEAAAAVLRGERHPRIGNAMFFHQAGLRTGYDNAHYVLIAGGNAFYERI